MTNINRIRLQRGRGGTAMPTSPPVSPPPPPPGSYPDAILGLGGTGPDLSAQYDLRLSGATGPTVAPTKPIMIDGSTLHPELVSAGAILDNIGQPSVTLTRPVPLDGFDCTLGAFGAGTRQLHIHSTTDGGTAVLTNWKTRPNMISWLGYNAGGSQIAANVLNVTYERCDCPGLQLFSIYGRGKFYYSTLRDAPNWYGSTAANNDGLLKADWIADHCSLTGGGLDADAVHTHFEPCQHNSNGLYQLVDSIFDLSNCQDVWPYTDPDTGWTAGIVSVTDAGGSGIAQAEILRSILIGIRANNKLGRSKIGQPIAMSEGGAAGTTVKDSVLEPGVFGYAVNNSPGGTTKATDLGGNRDWLTNVVVNVAA